MSDDVMTAIRYIFVISLILVILAYFAGSVNLVKAIGGSTNSLLLTVTGRNSSGAFASYPGGASA